MIRDDDAPHGVDGVEGRIGDTAHNDKNDDHKRLAHEVLSLSHSKVSR